ncbi:hypothetical protein [Microcystis phage Mel-JY33]
MRVKAKVTLQYGIIRKEGTEFSLTDPKHFDAKVMVAVDPLPKAAKAAGKAAAPAAAKKAEAPAAPTQPPAEIILDDEGDNEPVTEEGDEQADGGDAANETDEGDDAPAETVAAPAQGGSSAPVQRRRSTAAQRGNA